MEDSFIKNRNKVFDRFEFFSSKQQNGESVERFYGRLIEQSENCSLGDEKTTLIRGTFIFNYDTQKDFLKENLSPTKALEIAIHKEMGTQNKQMINQIFTKNAQSVNIINNFLGRNRTTNYQQQQK